jgi:pyrroline-5-carboxylate reductase
MPPSDCTGISGVLLVGCGNMGTALLGGWLDRGIAPGTITVIEPGPERAAAARARGVHVLAALDATTFPTPDVVVLAVKPQMLDEAAAACAPLAVAGAVVLSIAAGKTIAHIASRLGGSAGVVRAMPNTPAAVRQGITVACAGAGVSPVQRAVCDDLLSAVGSVLWVEDERLLDAVTAVSGSGPAYVFLLVESLARAGVTAGLPPSLADRLARETVCGAGALLARSAETAETLRRNVTSPGGTTASALSILMADPGGLPDLMRAAVDAATRRAVELSD